MKKLLQSLFILLFIAGSAMAQDRTVTGTVTSKADNKPLPGVTVKISGASAGTQTNSDGKYSLSVPSSANTLEFSYLGFVSQSAAVSNVVNVALEDDNKALSEVVVVGYQTLRRSDIVGNVSTVQGKEVAQQPATSFTQLLQGKATGVQVTGASGRPGANAFIKIRGVGSINAGTEPLIILDGLQITTAAYNSINPNDIEEVNILKDAASAAIYGSRAANGVIVIRTKTGKVGDPTLQYSFQYGKSEIQSLKNVELMNSAQKLQYEFELGYTNPQIDAILNPAGTPAGSKRDVTGISADLRQSIWDQVSAVGAGNWQDFLFQKGTVKTHEISLSGADSKIKYFMSLNSTNNDGTEINSYFNRKGGRLNVEYQAKEWFKMGTNLGATQSRERQVREPFNTQNLYGSLFFYNPYEPVRNADGSYNITHSGFSAIEGSENNTVFLNRVNTYGTGYAEARFFDHLTIRSQAALSYNHLMAENYLKPGSNLAVLLGYNSKTDSGNDDLFYTLTNTANWNQTIADKHNFNILVGQEFSLDNFYSYTLTGRNFATPSVETLENASTPITTSTSRSKYALESYFSAASYNYDQKYYLTASLRRDGSSRFGANNKYANFWAVGASWNIKKENFIQADWLNSLLLKASVGTTGNNNIGNYDALGTYSLTTKYNDLPTATPFRLPNPNLTWETSTLYDVSTNFGIIDNRISGELGYYKRVTDDLLYPVNVSYTTGFASFRGNIGNMQNSGIEASLRGEIIRNGDFSWAVNASFSSVDNKITKLYSDNATAPNTASYGKMVEGEALNTFFLVKWAGINPDNGKNQFYNIDGTITDTYSSSQAQLLKGKSPIAKFFGTIGTDFRYKDFDLGARFYYTGGNYILNVMDQVAASDGENVIDNQFTSALNYWKKPGDNVRYANPLDPTQNVTYDTDKYLEKGDYISLRDITLGYTLPTKYAKVIKTKSVRLFAQGTNLALWTKFRGLPEVGESNRERAEFAGTFNLYGYPPLKSYTFGIDVRF